MAKKVYNLYGMKLHDIFILTKTEFSSVIILRVPGGWLYEATMNLPGGGSSMTATFVPYSEEFFK